MPCTPSIGELGIVTAGSVSGASDYYVQSYDGVGTGGGTSTDEAEPGTCTGILVRDAPLSFDYFGVIATTP